MSAKVNIRHVEGVTILDVSLRITLARAASRCATPFRRALRQGKKLIVDMRRRHLYG